MLEYLDKADPKTLIEKVIIESVDRQLISIQNLDCEDVVFDTRHYLTIINKEDLNEIELQLFLPLLKNKLVSTVEFNFHLGKYFDSTSSVIKDYKIVKKSLHYLSNKNFVIESSKIFWTSYKLSMKGTAEMLNKLEFEANKYPALFEELYPIKASSLETLRYTRKGNYPKPRTEKKGETVPNNT